MEYEHEETRLVTGQGIGRARPLGEAGHAVFDPGAADINHIDLKPNIGADGMHKGQQRRIVMQGQTQTHYQGGAFGPGRVHDVGDSSRILIELFSCRGHAVSIPARANPWTAIDGCAMYKSRMVERRRERNAGFRLLFPVMPSPWRNPVKRLWPSQCETRQRRYMWPLLYVHIS
ncbi:hypothetical protein AAGU66_14985 [Edwardsiella ictaluri]|uniref:hypothetical protein n=1 Tax=Edwardsiella ictaluri TaxID=67780 RepID=UPI0011C03A5D|nr:hypothetical protein [Edwardsiella ictaluri]QPW31175.1 hypothetical protein F8539_15535 [Edwardsiella ictaluri]UCQ47417.1 hypothetical protein DB741_15790 [Edwardsiella ictaluri]UCQ50681.1 hypothetical protein DB731_15775 [Edwardsiella ictaluri]UYB61332.1 hypothetical protein N8I66_15510 [Edwardsiella ictaluri]UYB64559.1 hypothetical protein N8I67_15505 [Edwardsiella ictaluri]